MHKKLKYGFVKLTGIVAADKARFSKFVEVYPYEMMPFYEGEITAQVGKTTREGVDSSGRPYVVNLVRGISLKAQWKGENNRWFAPDVRKGELVTLYYFKETEEYFWETQGRDNHLRRGETVVYGWDASGASTADDIVQNMDNCYTFTVDTVGKHVTLKTTKANEEVSAFTMQFNGGNGTFTVQDDEGNIFQVNTTEKKVTMLNSDGTFVVLDKKHLTMHADKTVKIDAGETVNVYAGESFNVRTKKTNIESPTSIIGDTDIDGNLDVVGDVKVDGEIESTGDTIAGGISVMTHTHMCPGGMSPAESSSPLP